MGLLDILRQGFHVHCEAVVHRGDLDEARRCAPALAHALDGVVRAAVALMHLDRLRARGEREQLVAQTDAEQRHIGIEQRADHRHGIFAGRRRIARAVGEEHAVRLQRHDCVKAGLSRHHRHPRTGLHQIAEDIVLRAVIDRDHMRRRIPRRAAIAVAEPPEAALPAFLPLAGHADGKVHALQPRPRLGPLQQRGDIELAVRRMGDHRIGRARHADAAGERAGVDARQPDLAVPRQPLGETLDRAEVRRLGHILAHDTADRAFDLALDILGVRADIADMRKGESDDLRGVGGIGHHLLIAGHRGVEAHLAHGRTDGAKTLAPDHRAIGQNEDSRRA